MKKTLIALAFCAPSILFAQTTGTTTPSTTGTSTQVICIQTALEKRENALIAGHDVFNTAVKTALTNRLTSLKEAWAQTDKTARQTKRLASYKAFRTETQTAHNGMRTIRVGAWKTFETDMKACGVRGHGEVPNTVVSPTYTL